MSHIDPRTDRVRSKALDLARASVSGGRLRPKAYRSGKQMKSQLRRRRINEPLRAIKDVRCHADLECDCVLCDFDDDPKTAETTVRNGVVSWFAYWSEDHNSPGFRMARKKLIAFDGEFDPWFSWLKAYLPDSVAGRHLLDHIVRKVWCYRCIESAKQKFRGCTCGRDELEMDVMLGLWH